MYVLSIKVSIDFLMTWMLGAKRDWDWLKTCKKFQEIYLELDAVIRNGRKLGKSENRSEVDLVL